MTLTYHRDCQMCRHLHRPCEGKYEEEIEGSLECFQRLLPHEICEGG